VVFLQSSKNHSIASQQAIRVIVVVIREGAILKFPNHSAIITSVSNCVPFASVCCSFALHHFLHQVHHPSLFFHTRSSIAAHRSCETHLPVALAVIITEKST
jgi:hypothetical protein